jgi:hypothetical protein
VSYKEQPMENQTAYLNIKEAAVKLGDGITSDHIRGRIRRGSLKAIQDDSGNWWIPSSEVDRLLQERELCGNCRKPATQFVIVKYHFHERVEFVLCDVCAGTAETAYSRKGGVLEVISYPLLSEGWYRK